jgi:hypothetical protein
MSPDWTTIYRFRDDHEAIARLQRASLYKPDFGFDIKDGLVGSEEWWAKVESGSIPIQILRGVISRLGRGPNFSVLSDSGEQSQWTRLADSPLYKVENAIEIEYVMQMLKPVVAERWKTGPEGKIVVAVRIKSAKME